jgi:hypothetical protein
MSLESRDLSVAFTQLDAFCQHFLNAWATHASLASRASAFEVITSLLARDPQP